MSLDPSLKAANSLTRHRNVLTRAERLVRLTEQEKWTASRSIYGLPKVANRKMALAKAEKTDAAEGATPAAGAAPTAAAGAKGAPAGAKGAAAPAAAAGKGAPAGKAAPAGAKAPAAGAKAAAPAAKGKK
jgi:small basic protein (TIGR04137 family)